MRSYFSSRVLLRLVPGQRALLVLDAGDLRILLFLEVEPDQLLRHGRDRAEPAQVRDPCQHVGEAALETRREPSLPARRVVEPWLAIARFPLTAPATNRRANLEGRLDRLPPVLDLDRRNDLARRLLHDGNAGRLGAGIDLDPVLVHGRVAGGPVLEDDREGESTEDRGSALGQQDPSPRRRARIERLPVVVENKDLHVY